MKKNSCVGVLSTVDQPLLPFYLASILSQKIENIVVICDSKTITEKDKKIWQERTGGSFERVNGGNATIYQMEEARIPFYFVNNHNDDKTRRLINSLSVNVLLNAGTPRKLKSNIFDNVAHGCINVHPGLLPSYRGCSAVEWALLNDDKIGNTAHFMSEGYDEGNIISSEWYEFPKDTDYQSIRTRVYRDGVVLAGKALRIVIDNKMKPSDGIPQDTKLAQYWNPIPDEKFRHVLNKVSNQNYKYQRL
jgi:methionyl-tRNA formyltransferase